MQLFAVNFEILYGLDSEKSRKIFEKMGLDQDMFSKSCRFLHGNS